METYRASGKVNPIRFFLIVVLLSATALVSAPLYSAGLTFFPWVKLRILIVLAYGLGLGYLCGWLSTFAHVRSRPIVWLLTFSIVLMAYYMSWATHPWIEISKQAGPRFAWNAFSIRKLLPDTVIDWAQLRFQAGNGAARQAAAQGWFLVIAWIVEAGILFGSALKFANTTYKVRPYCEECKCWTEIEPAMANMPVRGDDPAWDRIAAGDLEALRKLKLEANPNHYVRLDLAICPQCSDQDYFSATAVDLVTTGDEVKSKERMVISHGRLTREQTNEIREFASELQEAFEAMAEEG